MLTVAKIQVKNTSEQFGVAFLGQIPLDAEVCTAGDLGVPIVAGNPESPQSGAFSDDAAKELVTVLEKSDAEDELTIQLKRGIATVLEKSDAEDELTIL